jgi:hypothetical protein
VAKSALLSSALERLGSRRRWELALPVLLTLGVLAITQRFSGLDTPDSSFYASLSIFGSEVTDRAPVDSYYWTRLGYIAPVRGLTLVLGPWLGLLAYKALLLLILTSSAYLLLRRHAPWLLATFLTLIVTTSTVILSYLGNPYLTGSVLAGTAAVIALGTRPTRATLAIAGVVLGWLAMVNPPGFLLAAVLWLTLAIHAGATAKTLTKRQLQGLALTAGTAAGTFLAFLALGALIFPGLNWWQTFTATTEITMSNFASTEPVWLRDISLLVPLSALLIVTATWLRTRASIAAQQAFLTSLVSITFVLVFSPIMGGITLEAPLYQAMLWPPALIAVTLAMTTRTPDFPGAPIPWFIITAAIGVALTIAAGFIDPGFTFTTGLIVTLVLTVIVVLTPRATIATVLALSAWAATAQLTQNSRDDLGLYYLSPYHWAYADNPIETKLRTAVNAQQWLLDNTKDTDAILVWVDGPWTQGDRELYVAAGMQLWGENRITLEPTLTDDYARTQLATHTPDVLALYGKSMDAVMAFWNSIPKENDPTAPICYDYAWPADTSSDFPTTQGHTCLTRLTWNDR